MKKISIFIFSIFTLLNTENSNAAIALDRTRAIYGEGTKSISLKISNESSQLPYLAQAWVEDENFNKITKPLLITPPIQRIEPGTKSMVRISSLPEIKNLPQDRETLFYFNLREIPPRSDKPNVMQIALQTRIKLFYRPSSIIRDSGEVWQNKLILTKEKNGYSINNPTGYYITITDIKSYNDQKTDTQFSPITVPPLSNIKLKTTVYDKFILTYINDYGGRPTLTFQCLEHKCQVKNI
ncbi:fimbria/pilus periplasmic chaperone [Proteus vulgaris]|jgi:chaperone protein PapD|uniref:Fimbrial chaperone protein n=2 Tax=Proteus vulgaris TaxID=585 RepID=A0A379FC27_PROVU|nr:MULTISPECIES: fimbria/pilus periplasmic chaperone [Proteus]RNT32044.1 fimbrial protein [Proteus mirabilis]AYY81534.1 fimbrial protein [Proteus vulgaris]KGA58553.1 chaperone protein papD [Proteus vulgaris]MBG5969946.1 fimbria/pilus periplasmic chaperone [Proteus vulgaris]MBG5986803.1 fimbria/pilus periplasmic chaperone [Proteus vulgaris]